LTVKDNCAEANVADVYTAFTQTVTLGTTGGANVFDLTSSLVVTDGNGATGICMISYGVDVPATISAGGGLVYTGLGTVLSF
jgi:hypothetical protein